MEKEIISFLINPPFSNLILVIKIIFLVISSFLFGFIIYLLLKTSWLNYRYTQDIKEFLNYKSVGAPKLVKQWLKIKERLETNLESEFKLAVIEADTLLDDILKKMGYVGDTLEEKLEKVSINILPSKEKIKEAHKLRDNIVYDPDFSLSLEEVKKIISVYETALTELNVI